MPSKLNSMTMAAVFFAGIPAMAQTSPPEPEEICQSYQRGFARSAPCLAQQWRRAASEATNRDLKAADLEIADYIDSLADMLRHNEITEQQARKKLLCFQNREVDAALNLRNMLWPRCD
jgi:hypothetical protein